MERTGVYYRVLPSDDPGILLGRSLFEESRLGDPRQETRVDSWCVTDGVRKEKERLTAAK